MTLVWHKQFTSLLELSINFVCFYNQNNSVQWSFYRIGVYYLNIIFGCIFTMAMCIYTNCNSVQKPFSRWFSPLLFFECSYVELSVWFTSLAFFALPKDARRKLWIENSGNPQLTKLSESARRVVCEKHFSPSYLRKQFHRTILSR